MITTIVVCFALCYLAIALEHKIKLDKTIPALAGAALTWGMISIGQLSLVNHLQQKGNLSEILLHHTAKIAEILFFLIGAMVIVELIDLHQGFSVITRRIHTTSKKGLLWLICLITFFLSAVLDNLTCTIMMVSLLRRLVPEQNERIWYVSFAIIAANAGGAWSPIGDVTTTMLWIDHKVTTAGLVINLFIPSLLSLLVPVFIAGLMPSFRSTISPATDDKQGKEEEHLRSSQTMLIAGIAGLLFVPVFKTFTGLPPFLGMMLSLSLVWLVSEFIHPSDVFNEERRYLYSARHALSRIEMSSILFFLGILFMVAALESVTAAYRADGTPVGLLMLTAEKMGAALPSIDIVVISLGALSAIIDNVPLVAATMGMYPMDLYPTDSKLWPFIAYAAGTGGSMLIIGSAAGVAAMGMERIDFIWYLKKVSGLALIGFIAGNVSFLLLFRLLH